MIRPTDKDRAAYKEWLESHPGNTELSPKIREQVQKEMETGRKGDYAVYGDEPGKGKLVKSLPQGELLKTELSTEQLAGALDFFKEYLPQIKDWIEKGFISTEKRLTLEQEIKNLSAKQGSLRTEEEILFHPEILMALNRCLEYEIPPNTEMYDLIEEINDKARKFSAVYIERLAKEAGLR